MPKFQPVSLTLNGVPQGIYVLTERINEGFLDRRWSHSDFIVIPGKPPWDEGLAPFAGEVRSWSAKAPAPFTAKIASERIDVENFTRWLLAVVYAGTGDAFQSHMVRNRRDRLAKWFWISWTSTSAFAYRAGFPSTGGRKDLLWFMTKGAGGWGSGPRNIAYRLLTEDDDFKRRFSESMVMALNHEIDRDFMAERVSHYQEVANRLGLEPQYQGYFDDLRAFVEHRPGAIRSQLQTHLGAGAEVRLRLASPGDNTVLVDGFAVGRGWEGVYLEGMTPRLNIAPSAIGSFSHWEVDGDRVDGLAIARPLMIDSDIVAVFD